MRVTCKRYPKYFVSHALRIYAWLNRNIKRLKLNKQLLTDIKHIHTKTRSTYEDPRITEDFLSRGLSVGHNRLARLMKEAGLLGRQKR